jgi:hypothetical protein
MTQTVARERTTAEYARGALFGLAAVLIWAGNIVAASVGLRSSLTPWDISAIRFGVAGLVLMPYLMGSGLAVDRLGWIGLVALVLGGAPTVLLANAGLLFAPASHAGALFPGVMPLVVAVLSAAILKETFTVSEESWLLSYRNRRRRNGIGERCHDRHLTKYRPLAVPRLSVRLRLLHSCDA